MPLNMNTIGTGTGIGGSLSSGGYSTIQPTYEQLLSKTSSIDMDTFPVITNNAYVTNVGSNSLAQAASYPIMRYKGKLYTYFNYVVLNNGYSSATKDRLFIKNSNNSYTEITIPFSRIYQLFTYRNVVYMLAGTYYICDRIYSFDGDTFTVVCNNLVTAGIYPYTIDDTISFHITPMTYSKDDSLYMIIGGTNGNSYRTAYLSIGRIDSSGKFEVILPTKKLLTDNATTMNGSSVYSVIQQNILVGLTSYASVGSGSINDNRTIGLQIRQNTSNEYVFRISHGFVLNYEGTNGTTGLDNYIFDLSFKLDDSDNMYHLSFTQVSKTAIDSISGISIKSGYGTNGRFYSTILYPLTYDEIPDTYIMVTHRGYLALYNSSMSSYDGSSTHIPYIYLINIYNDSVAFKQLTFGKSETVLGGNGPMSHYGIIDMNSNEPGYMMLTYDRYSSGDYYYNNYAYQLDTTKYSYKSSESRCTIKVYLKDGDTCYCDAGIISYTFVDTSSYGEVGKSELKITKSGWYEIITEVHDAYTLPEFIIISKNGCIMNLRDSYDNVSKTYTAFLRKGMYVNGMQVETSGYNKFTIDTPRIDIKM